ncbi:MAG: YceI family protein [Calditrichia bacterium]
MRIKILFLLLLSFLYLFADEFHVDKSSDNRVIFISQAPLESFEGRTNHVDGYIYWEGDKLTGNSQIYMEVDLNSLDTGIGLRNRHMRENYLETQKWPKTWFKGKIIEVNSTDNDSVMVKVEGTIFIHGVEKPLTTEGTLLLDQNQLSMNTAFEVKLSDFNIKIPKIMFLKLDEVIKLHLNVTFKKIEE